METLKRDCVLADPRPDAIALLPQLPAPLAEGQRPSRQ